MSFPEILVEIAEKVSFEEDLSEKTAEAVSVRVGLDWLFSRKPALQLLVQSRRANVVTTSVVRVQ